MLFRLAASTESEDNGNAEENSSSQLEARVAENQRIIEELNKSWEEKLKEALASRHVSDDEVFVFDFVFVLCAYGLYVHVELYIYVTRWYYQNQQPIVQTYLK